MTTLRAQDLLISIAGKKLLSQFNLTFLPGEMWGIIGPNGVGKTTLLHVLAGLHMPATGNVLLGDKNIKQLNPKLRAQKIGLLAQDSDFSFPSTVFEAAMIGRYPYSSRWFGETVTDIACVKQALNAMELDKLIHRFTTTLSGGEKRRLALATLLAQEPDIYLLDEPTNHLDIQQKICTLKILQQLAKVHGKTMIMILHDIYLIRTFCDKAIIMGINDEHMCGDCHEIMQIDNLGKVFSTDTLRVYL